MQLFRKKEKNDNKDLNKEKAPKSETYEMVVKHVKRSALVGLIASAVVVMVATVSVLTPYAVTADGETLCYVRNKENAAQVTRTVIDEYLPEGTTLQAVSMDGDIGIAAASPLKALGVECVSVDDAVVLVKERIENPDEYKAEKADETKIKVADADNKVDNIVITATAMDENTEEQPAEAGENKAVTENAETADTEADCTEPEENDPSITIVSTAEVTESYKAEVEYVQDDSMLAGDSEVQAEGKEGTKVVLRQFTSVNGEVTDTTDIQTDIIEEAEPKVIVKGTLGLPEGEDWKTYEGDPIFNDGEALVKTSLKYLGAPYKYGGYSLTTGIDCVQFIRQMYAKYGISLPNGKNALKHVGTAVSYENAKPGDIICYSNHYAIYMGDGKIVHATSKGGVKTRDNAKFRKIVTIRRIPRS